MVEPLDSETRDPLRPARPRNPFLEKFAGIEETTWVDGSLESVMKLAKGWRGCPVPPRFLGETNAVLAANDAPHRQDALEQLVEDAVHVGIVGLRAGGSHQVDVDIAVPGVPEAGDRNLVFLLPSYRDWETDRKSTRLNSSHLKLSRMPSSA